MDPLDDVKEALQARERKKRTSGRLLVKEYDARICREAVGAIDRWMAANQSKKRLSEREHEVVALLRNLRQLFTLLSHDDSDRR